MPIARTLFSCHLKLQVACAASHLDPQPSTDLCSHHQHEQHEQHVLQMAARDTTCSTPHPSRATNQLDSKPTSPPPTASTWKCCQSNPCCNHDVPQLCSKQSSRTSIATHTSSKAMAARVPGACATPLSIAAPLQRSIDLRRHGQEEESSWPRHPSCENARWMRNDRP